MAKKTPQSDFLQLLRSTNLSRQDRQVMGFLWLWLSEQSEQSLKCGQQQVGSLCKLTNKTMITDQCHRATSVVG